MCLGMGLDMLIPPVCRHAASTRSRLYPAFVKRTLINTRLKRMGTCQERGCEAQSTYLRGWIFPDREGHVEVANLNGARYCDAHVQGAAFAASLPLIHDHDLMQAYVARVRAVEESISAGAPTMPVPVRVVGRRGVATADPDGSLVVTLADGRTSNACCNYVAATLIGLKIAGRTRAHHPACLVERDGDSKAPHKA